MLQVIDMNNQYPIYFISMDQILKLNFVRNSTTTKIYESHFQASDGPHYLNKETYW